MKSLLKNPLLYINAVLVLFIVAFVLHANAERFNLPSVVKEALAATVGVITDGGTSGRLTVFAGTNNKIGDSVVRDNGVNIGVGMDAPARGTVTGPGQADRDGTIFAAGHIAATNAVTAGTTMQADDYYSDDLGRWMSQLISGTCEEYVKPTATAETLTVTFCWGTASRGPGGTSVLCSGGTARKTIMNADDIVGENETTSEGYNLGQNCGPFPVSGTTLKLCHVTLVACMR